MRHQNRLSVSMYSPYRGKHIYRPTQRWYINSYINAGGAFPRANSKCRYVQILQYIADHDGCTRFDVQRNVWNFHNIPCHGLVPSDLRGYASAIFSQLLYIDVIDYDKNFRYHITPAGRKVLETAYLNDMAKFVNRK